MTLFQRASLLATVLVTLVAFGIGAEWFANQGPSTRHLASDEPIGTTYGSVTMPAGWDLHIGASVQRQPLATSQGVEIAVSDGVWLEDSAHLLRNVASLLFSSQPSLPDAPTDDGLLTSLTDASAVSAQREDPERHQWRIEAPSGASVDEPRYVDVVRYGELVVIVVVRGEADAVARQAATADAVTASVDFADVAPALEPAP